MTTSPVTEPHRGTEADRSTEPHRGTKADRSTKPNHGVPVTTPDRSALPPGPKLPYHLQTLLVWQFTGPFLRYCRRRYGPTFTVRAFPAKAMVYVTDPDDVKAVFAAAPDVLHAGEANAILGPVLGRRSILLADEDEHLRRRRLMLPFFHGDSVRRYTEVVNEIADAEIATWPQGKPIGLHKRMQAITLEVILRAVIGVEDPVRLEQLRLALRRTVELTTPVLLMWAWPALGRVGIWRRQLRWQAAAEALLGEEIAARRTAPDLDRRGDILSMLIRARYDDDSAMDDDELRDQVMTMLLAGHETTATGLAWAFERLARHPAVLARAERAGREGDEDYLDALVKETLRSRPVIPDVARQAAKPFSLAGYDLPAGVTLMPSICLVQQSEVFPEPDVFAPERFLDGAGGRAPGTYGWIPFGGGRRRCLGAAFATLEMRLVIERVLAQVELSAPHARDEWALPRHITLVPARGARLRIRHRRDPAGAKTEAGFATAS
jgi:cytochrome P450 family 135